MKLFEVMSKSEIDRFEDLCYDYIDDPRGKFTCTRHGLTSLKGSPPKISGDFDCAHNNLTSLKDGPDIVAGSYWCSHNQLESLEGITSKIGLILDCSHNKIKSFHNIHKMVTSMGGPFYAWNNPTVSHILGFLLIDGCTELGIINAANRNDPISMASRIVNKYLPNKEGMAGVLKCQEELFAADFDEFAQL